MELRQAGKDEPQGDVQSAENANTDATFSKLRFSVIIEVDKYYITLCCGCVV